MITTTSLQHPTLIKKILGATREAMRNGYGRVYNSKGDFMCAVFYSRSCNNFVVGSNYCENTNISGLIKKVFQNSCKPGLVALSSRFVV